MIKNVSYEEARRKKSAIAVDSLIFTVTTEEKKIQSRRAGKNSCPDLT